MTLFFLIDEGQIREVEDLGFVEYSPMAPLGQFSLKLGKQFSQKTAIDEKTKNMQSLFATESTEATEEYRFKKRSENAHA